MKIRDKLIAATLILSLTVTMGGCAVTVGDGRDQDPAGVAEASDEASAASLEETPQETTEETTTEEASGEEATEEEKGKVCILYTSDVHCGIDEGFGYAGLQQIRESFEKQGYATLLVDDGDYVQGELVGTLDKGESMIGLMNDLHYDAATIGNHEFDYGMDRFFELTDMADFSIVSCNFTHEDKPVFDPYVIKEAAGHKIAFVGISTPTTIVTSTPGYFCDENGNFVYGFMQDETGQAVYDAVQEAVDDARDQGAEFVYVLAHLGNEASASPWTYADVISHTDGIDVFLDGHSHDTEQVVMKNKDGAEVPRSAVGTKLNCVGYSLINEDGEIEKTDILSWPNKDGAPGLLGIENAIEEQVQAALAKADEEMKKVVAHSDVDLTINDPTETDGSGNPLRRIRIAETNLGDLCADAYRDQSGADVAFVNGGGIRTSIEKGDITYGDIVSVHPFGNQLTEIEVTGQQILDALEWGAKTLPDEDGGFIQVSGLTYEIHMDVKSPCRKDESGMFTGISGERRVQNVKVGGADIDPKKTYTLAGHDYMLLNHGDGFTMFDGANVTKSQVKIDNQVLIDYIVDTLGGTVGKEYDDPYGEGRIVIIDD